MVNEKQKKELTEYIFGELSKCIHLQPRQKKEFTLPVTAGKGNESILVEKNEQEGTYHLIWRRGFDNIIDDAFFVIPTNIYVMKSKINKMIDAVYLEDEKEAFEDTCYNLYQLEWLMSNGYSLTDAFKALTMCLKDNIDEDTEYIDAENYMNCAKDDFVMNKGFGKHVLGDIIMFSDKDKFLREEYLDPDYMKWLFETKRDVDGDKLRAQYLKFTGIDVTKRHDLKVHTSAGTIRVYKDKRFSTSDSGQGIRVMLSPKGYDEDQEIDVMTAYASGANLQMLCYEDASTDCHTHELTIKREDIEYGLNIKTPESQLN